MKIADPNGVWLISTAHYRLPDPESGTFFEPGEPTKAVHTAWAQAQAAIQPCDDPTAPAPAPAPEAPEAPKTKK